MKTSLFLGAGLTALLLTSAASAAITKYPVTLNGAQENPPVTTAAAGTGELEFDDATNKLTGKIEYSGLSGAPTAAHIHAGACGANGGVAHALPDPDEEGLEVDVTLTAGQVTQLVAGELYVNVHTAANGGGEIRGQLYPEGSTSKCPADAPDGGSSGGTPDSGGGNGNGNGNGDGSSSGGSANDAGTVRADGGSTAGAAPAEDDGCSTTGTSPGSGLAIAFGVAVAIAAIGRGRRKR